MTHYLKTIVALILCVITCSTMSAKFFYIDGIFYATISDNSNDVNVCGCDLSGNVSIPSSVENEDVIYNVIGLDHSAFKETKVTSITLPESIKSIGNEAFCSCSNLVSITLPQNLVSIGEGAFRSCSGLTSIELPQNLASIEKQTFYECSSLTSITLPESIKSIEREAFSFCANLTSISFPLNLASIGAYAFRSCSSLMSISLPESLKTIEDGAFCACTNITSISFPQNLTTIGRHAFSGCHELTNIDLKHTSLTEIRYNAFSDCYMVSSISLPNSLITIGSSAFYGVNITSIMLPPNLSKLGVDALGSCKHIERVYCTGKMAANTYKDSGPYNTTSTTPFSDETYANATLYIPTGRIPIYEQVGCWHNFNTIKEWDPETNISDIIDEDCESKIIVDIYDINGRKTTMDSRGIIFIRYADGTIKKQIN